MAHFLAPSHAALATHSRSDQCRLIDSVLAEDNVFLATAEVSDWLRQRASAGKVEVARIPFDRLVGWYFDPNSGNLVHDTGRFFSVEGLDVRTDYGTVPHWGQPIINQPEIGILGILVKEMHGVLHFLMQAKVEPGNVNKVQLSPTVQATRSNYTRSHGGMHTRYLEHFVEPGRGRMLVDLLQSEQGARFYRKRNRNMVVEVTEDVPAHDDFCWLTLGQIRMLLRQDDIVNMDARTVLACLSAIHEPTGAGGVRQQPFLRSLHGPDGSRAARADPARSDEESLHTIAEVLSWLTELTARYQLDARLIPLSAVSRWYRSHDEIFHEEHQHFTVIAVSVAAGSREVAFWTQPMICPRSQGIVAFLVRRIRGVLHVLVQGKVEAGNRDVVEMTSTVHCALGGERDGPTRRRSPFLDDVLGAPPSRVLFDALQSEEGGRFFQEQNRHLIIEVDEDVPLDVPVNYIWLTLNQLKSFVRYNRLAVQARSLLACLHGDPGLVGPGS